MRRPVIATNTGGPLETVLDGETGFLCEPEEDSFSKAMQNVINESEIVEKFGERARNHVIINFSFDAFTENLDRIVCRLHFFNFNVHPVD